MQIGTDGTAATIIVLTYDRRVDQRRSDIMHRYARMMFPQSRSFLDQHEYVVLELPLPAPPAWLTRTERRLDESVSLDPTQQGDGRHLSQVVVNASKEFLRRTADLLPGEPFIYSSSRGDLVAEFQTSRGLLTSIVSPDFVILYAAVDGKPEQRQFADTRNVRPDVKAFVEQLQTPQNGEMDSTR